jgi:glycosyltransferase involved in cell wall biosynthesis
MHITICACTYQRPVLLERLLRSLCHLKTEGEFTYSIVVTDNDQAGSALPVVEQMRKECPVPITYALETRRSISHARNTGLAHAEGDFIATIDDDEYASPEWLLALKRTLERYQAPAVLGPVLAYFDTPPEKWVLKGKFCDRPRHPTGYRMHWGQCRTGNVLFDKRVLDQFDPVFNPDFGTGGSDVELFRRLIERGHVPVWCDEAPVHEIVPPSRATRSYMLRRGLLRGSNGSRHSEGQHRAVMKAVVALPSYLAMLPFLQLAGHHHFMRYLISWCDHAGRVLGLLGIHPIKERPM